MTEPNDITLRDHLAGQALAALIHLADDPRNNGSMIGEHDIDISMGTVAARDGWGAESELGDGDDEGANTPGGERVRRRPMMIPASRVRPPGAADPSVHRADCGDWVEYSKYSRCKAFGTPERCLRNATAKAVPPSRAASVKVPCFRSRKPPGSGVVILRKKGTRK
jgi:hypothetical protein